jgi:long-chain acyl-CoA synthetase
VFLAASLTEGGNDVISPSLRAPENMAPPRDTASYIKELSTPPPPGSPQAVPIPGTERDGRTPIYRNWRFRDGPLLWTFDPAVQTTYDLFVESATKYPNSRCLGSRNWNTTSKSWEDKYDWITYAQTAVRVEAFGAGLVEILSKAGLKSEKCGVGLWAQNRPEWQIAGTYCQDTSNTA